MLKLTARSEYGLLLVKYLVDHPGSISLKMISKELKIPEPILRKVSQKLVAGGICISHKGRLGGVGLINKTPSVYDVLQTLGEDMNVVLCTEENTCHQESVCRISPTLKRLQRGMESLLKITKI